MHIPVQLNLNDLEEHPTNPETAAIAVGLARTRTEMARQAAARPQPSPTELGILGRELGRLADSLRLSGQTQEALEAFEEVIALWDDMGRLRAAFMARLRLALLHRASGHPDKAHALLDQLCAHCANDPKVAMYHSFALHHRGIAAWKTGHHHDAFKDLQEALDMRLSKGSKPLIDATTAVLKHLQTLHNDARTRSVT